MERFMERPAGFSSVIEDLISNLPDALISQILLYLPTKEAVRTSVLSNRWKSVWLLIPGLDLNSTEFPSENAFAGFIEKFLDFSKGENSCLHKLKLSIRNRKDEYENQNDKKSCVTRWIDFVLTHKLKHLDVECLLGKRECLEVIPLSLYISQTLLYLRLHQVLMTSFESVSLPCLKTMHLEQNVYANETCLESLISSCPVLEDLSIVRTVYDNVEFLRVISQSLTSLSISFDFCERHRETRMFDRDSGVLIDAPRLKYLKFKDELSWSKIVSNCDSLAKVEFVGPFYIQETSQMALNVFTGISRVRDMIISISAMTFIDCYLKVESTAQFCNLSYLEAQFYCFNTNSISPILERCPNLKSIVLDLIHPNCMTRAPISFPSVPQCLLSSLEFVKIKCGYNGGPAEIKVAKYFVENSVVLKKLVVHLSLSMQRKFLVDLRNLFALRPRRSSECQIKYVTEC